MVRATPRQPQEHAKTDVESRAMSILQEAHQSGNPEEYVAMLLHGLETSPDLDHVMAALSADKPGHPQRYHKQVVDLAGRFGFASNDNCGLPENARNAAQHIIGTASHRGWRPKGGDLLTADKMLLRGAARAAFDYDD
jgi:hypothetical protein